jgi:radical SAM superfamily enzyme YgiQ (UPF0313 family)
VKQTVLFLQVPLADNDPASHAENVPMAAACLRRAARRAAPGAFRFELLPDSLAASDNRSLVRGIAEAGPDVTAATLYAWNIERTLRVLGEARKALPGLKVVAGGPEVAADHPFLAGEGAIDAAVSGEGEGAFAAVLHALRSGLRADFTNVAWRAGGALRWGRRPPPEPRLAGAVPPASDSWAGPTRQGTAYAETTRGCPLNCAFCCYDMRRGRLSFVPAAAVARRVLGLRDAGASEIRFVDPSLNAHPQFDLLLSLLCAVNRDGRLRFSGELLADRLTVRQADLIARAGFAEVEVGVQSLDRAVLRAVNRPGTADGVRRGIRLLAGRRVPLILDAMSGLPGQTAENVKRTVDELASVPRAHVQLLPLLLLPGTELRRRRRELGLEADELPPYRVRRTPHMTEADFLETESYAASRLGRDLDSPAARFVGRDLPDLFAERVALTPAGGVPDPIPGSSLRRALVLKDDDLFANRAWVGRVITAAILAEPDMLWQFVLCPAREEPLDLIELAAAAINRAPDHFVDRLKIRKPGEHRVSRRVFVLLRDGCRYDRRWQAEAESLLGRLFY